MAHNRWSGMTPVVLLMSCLAAAACGNNVADEDGASKLCESDKDCCPGQECTGGVCTWRNCTGDLQCGGAVCIGGTCAARPPCASDADCGTTRSCVAGECAPNAGCSSDLECPTSHACQNGTCTRNNACGSDMECPSTQFCADGVCTRNGSCTGNADCPASQRCDNGTCSRNPSCTRDSECDGSMACVDGTCTRNGTCTTDNQCPATQRCIEGLCTRNGGCSRNQDCLPSQQCVDGTCTRNPGCTTDDQCPATMACVDNQCVRNNTCTSTAECPVDQQCVANTCTRNPGCMADRDCPTTQSCVDNVCTRNMSCSTDAMCDADQFCDNGTCTRNPSCTMDEQCDEDEACLNGTCSRLPMCPATACPEGYSCVNGGCTRNPPCADSSTCPMGLACINMACVPFTPGTLTCPAAPMNVRILDQVTLTAMLNNVTPGAHSVGWTVVSVIDSQMNNVPDTVALQNANTATVRFNPVIPGAYTLRATLVQPWQADQTCDVVFNVAGPTADFNAQLIMNASVDVDLHVMHPLGRAMGGRDAQANTDYFFSFNWGPPEPFTCNNNLGLVTCNALEQVRTMPDCHFANCTACSVVVPGQPACTTRTLRWNEDAVGMLMEPDSTAHNYSYMFGMGSVLASNVNPKLDIDNRRGCYLDALGNRVCTPEQISINKPANGTYTIAVHYFGTPYVPGDAASNQRGQPAGATVSVEVELFCRGSATSPEGGFRRFTCTDIPVDGWCFVADVTWGAGGCTAISANATRQF